jgi:hypothetical protein
MRYRSKETVEAEQFLPPNQVPKGIFNLSKIKGQKLAGSTYNLRGKKVRIIAGSWIIYPKKVLPGRYLVLSDEDFRNQYEIPDGVDSNVEMAVTYHNQ